MVDHKDKLSYASRLDENVAMEVVDKIQTIQPKLKKNMLDCNFFQEPYTKAKVSSIFQNKFFAKTEELLKELIEAIKVEEIPDLMGYYSDPDDALETSFAESDDEIISSTDISNQPLTLTSNPNKEQCDEDKK